ncbi:MAG: hypothetical protein COS84_06205 [Armatimonadetes bacterium CG07_land_8_20_14_0_80_40_9]|nr:MAG: hypothetical protein COS84_06205 [Armatimonadetes bacterium CG07_land_8_20_14_0_80_40_9]
MIAIQRRSAQTFFIFIVGLSFLLKNSLLFATPTEDRRQKSEDRSQRTEVRQQMAEIAHRLQLLPSAISNEPSATHGLWTMDYGLNDVRGQESKVLITALSVSGNINIPAEKILGVVLVKVGEVIPAVASEKGRVISSPSLQKDSQAILDLGLFQSVEIKLERFGDGFKVIFQVVENPKIKKIKVLGNTLFAESLLLEQMETAPQEVLSQRRLEKDLQRIANIYKEGGYIGGVLDTDLDEQGILTLKVGEGKIGEVKIEGNELIDEEEIKFNLISSEGKIFKLSTLEEDLKRLLNLGYFKKVGYELKPAEEKDKVILVIKVKERWKKQISKVEVAGNQRIGSELILSVASLKIGDTLSKERLKEDLEAINALGFFSQVSPDLEDYAQGTKLRFIVVENPSMEKIKFEGNTIFSSQELLSLLKTKPQEILNFNLLSEDRERIEQYYWQKGYIVTRLYDDEIEQIGKEGKVLTLTIGEGKVEEIKIIGQKEEEITSPEGNKENVVVPCSLRTKDYVIKRELKTKVGEILDVNKINKDLQGLHNLGYFENLGWDPEAGSKPDGVIVAIKIKEGPPRGTAMFGAGYGSRGKWTGSVSVSKDNLWGKGRRASISAEFGEIKSYSLSYYEPWVDKKHTSLGLSLFDTTIRREQRVEEGIAKYDEVRRGGSIIVGRPLKEDVRLSVGFKNEKVDIIPTSEVKPEEEYLVNKGITRSLTFTLVKDTRDNVFNATSGGRDSLSLEFCGGLLGGDFSFVKTQLDLRRYLKVRKTSFVFANRLQLGVYKGAKLIYEEFDLGGAETLRGYEESIFGGNKMAILNSELRFPISGGLTGVIFTDAGNAWPRGRAVRELKVGSGFGIRYNIPGLGPIRLDYGYNWEIRAGQMYFSFGQMF